MLSEPPEVGSARDFSQEIDFLRRQVRALAKGRYRDELDDVASEAWIRLDRALRREEARDIGALMSRIAWRSWVDFYRRRMAEARALGAPIPADDVDLHAAEPDAGVDLDALAAWRFSVCEWFAKHHPACLEPARQMFEGRSWVEAGEALRERPNSLAKRWQRCRERFVSTVRADRGDLRHILDYFERGTS